MLNKEFVIFNAYDAYKINKNMNNMKVRINEYHFNIVCI
jgi:hypothetical protein